MGGFLKCLFSSQEEDPEWQRSLEILNSVEELSYMTQIVFKLYEDQTCDDPDQRFRIELHFSDGALGLNSTSASCVKKSDAFRRASGVRQLMSDSNHVRIQSMVDLPPTSPSPSGENDSER